MMISSEKERIQTAREREKNEQTTLIKGTDKKEKRTRDDCRCAIMFIGQSSQQRERELAIRPCQPFLPTDREIEPRVNRHPLVAQLRSDRAVI